MELFLNAVWVAIIAIGVWLLCGKQRNAAHRNRFWCSFGPLLCAAALLFPSISASDDIHFDAFVFEDANSAKRMHAVHAASSAAAPLFWLPAALILGCAAFFDLRWQQAVSRSLFYRVPLFNRGLLGRAPPATYAY